MPPGSMRKFIGSSEYPIGGQGTENPRLRDNQEVCLVLSVRGLVWLRGSYPWGAPWGGGLDS